jgi:itaconate CoA-transferase
VLRRPELAADERYAGNHRRDAARAEVQALVAREAFAPLTAAEVVARLDAAGIANARVDSMAEVWAHPQLAARGRWTTIGSPVGPLPALWPPGAEPGEEGSLGAIPALGEHTEAILGELGVGAAERAALRAAGAA